ncbi:MAG: 4-hydroxythreonine-4-phosphate dehydrogenase PdxA [Proteobacteria bacterium]|nr:4-hydroxythreonine-4-phosphate dehydrogenase PdxA [Pseudomonadota bacterium]
MKNNRPVIGITSGDPAGIGPEIILSALSDSGLYQLCKPLVVGDIGVLAAAKKCTGSSINLKSVSTPSEGSYNPGSIDILSLSRLTFNETSWGNPTVQTGKAMVEYVIAATDMAINKEIAAVVTCPINKKAMNMAGFHYNGHTELIAERTGTKDFVMMLAGDRLRVSLVTIHIPLSRVSKSISTENISKTIRITGNGLYERFGIDSPLIAVAGLNPHAGESGIFGDEEERIIRPAVEISAKEGYNVSGPYPPDTIFYNALKGDYDAVVCMYHDQGLIPFKIIHFTDGVNTTLGIPIIRTSVDHGTAYDIAGKGKADPGSLIAAIKMAAFQASCLNKRIEVN